MRVTRSGALVLLSAFAFGATAQDKLQLKLSGEIKANVRSSSFVELKLRFPFPPDFIPPGQDGVYMRTVSDSTSAEISNVALQLDAQLTPDISGRARIHFIDLYNRNPTSSDDKFAVREAWVRFGQKYESLEAAPGTSFYALVGKAPRFTKQLVRRLESYGMWGTAVGRFEEVQVQLGGSVGKHVYWRGHVANGNPLFFRDPNALAGDNGTPERVPGNVHPVYESGFPILYDAKAGDLNFSGTFEYGGGLGFRLLSASGDDGIDVMGWYFTRQMADQVSIRGTYYSGDIKLLQAFESLGIAFALTGRQKWEAGVNVDVRFGNFRLFGQFVDQSIGGLKRNGFEVEAAWVIPLNGLFLSGETPILNYVTPTVRFSNLANKFFTPRTYPATSVGWEWEKYDYGVRIGILRGVDLTAEYSRHDMVLFSGTILHPDEWLVTLRAGF